MNSAGRFNGIFFGRGRPDHSNSITVSLSILPYCTLYHHLIVDWRVVYVCREIKYIIASKPLKSKKKALELWAWCYVWKWDLTSHGIRPPILGYFFVKYVESSLLSSGYRPALSNNSKKRITRLFERSGIPIKTPCIQHPVVARIDPRQDCGSARASVRYNVDSMPIPFCDTQLNASPSHYALQHLYRQDHHFCIAQRYLRLLLSSLEFTNYCPWFLGISHFDFNNNQESPRALSSTCRRPSRQVSGTIRLDIHDESAWAGGMLECRFGRPGPSSTGIYWNYPHNEFSARIQVYSDHPTCRTSKKPIM
jgi:hypothetical protein